MGTDVGSNDIRRLLKSGDGRGKVSLVSVCVRECVCVCASCTIMPTEGERGASNPSYETRQGETVRLKILLAPSDIWVVFLFFCPRTFSCI